MESLKRNESWEVAEISLVYRTAVQDRNRPTAVTPTQSYDLLINSWNQNTIELREEFKILLLSSNNRVLGLYEVSTGGTDSTVVDSKLIFAAAIKANAAGIILAHNHPSGNLEPSISDRKITGDLKKIGELLNIPILDHIILSPFGFFSFANECIL